jgi:hypothetical protein
MRLPLYSGNQGPVPPRGQNKAVIPPYLLRDFNHLPNKIPHSPASLFGNQPISIKPNLSRQFWPAPGEPDPDSNPLSWLSWQDCGSVSQKRGFLFPTRPSLGLLSVVWEPQSTRARPATPIFSFFFPPSRSRDFVQYAPVGVRLAVPYRVILIPYFGPTTNISSTPSA